MLCCLNVFVEKNLRDKFSYSALLSVSPFGLKIFTECIKKTGENVSNVFLTLNQGNRNVY
jgi:hypothetical protein